MMMMMMMMMMMIAQTDEAPDNEHERNTLKSCSAITKGKGRSQ